MLANMQNKHLLVLVIVFLCTGILTGCGSGNDNSKPSDSTGAPAPKEPVTLTLMPFGVPILDDDFQKLFLEPVKKKYPHISINLIKQVNDIDQLVASREIPDILALNPRSLATFDERKMIGDLNDVVKKYNFDMQRYDSNVVQMTETMGGGKRLLGIPFYQNLYALFYNKDLFDKFGVAYPKDGMTWSETIELAKKVARMEDGVQYRGLTVGYHGLDNNEMLSSFAMSYVNPKTMKADVNTDVGKKALSVMKQIDEIPGNPGGDVRDTFNKDRVLAMMVSMSPRLNELEELHKKGQGVNYDLAAPPYFPEMPNKTMEADVRVLSVSSTTKHKDAAFQAIDAIASAENQLAFVRKGFPPVLKDAIKRHSLNDGKIDINTALREAEEAINKLVEEREK